MASSTNTEEPAPEFTPDQLTLHPFRVALGTTPCMVAGGYNPSNCWEGIERVRYPFDSSFGFESLHCLFIAVSYQGDHDAIAFGRYFTSNADLVERLRIGKPFFRYGTFYLSSPATLHRMYVLF